MQKRLVARAPVLPVIWLGDRERASHVAPRLGEHYPASHVKERDLVIGLDSVHVPRDPVG